MSEPLTGAQEEHAREIAKQEVASFARLLLEEIGRTPLRADGAMNARDLHECVRDAHRRFNEGDVVL